MNKTWADLERRQLSPIRAWSKANLTERRPVTFYFFSGPNFLYINSFYPNSDTYVLAGLEPHWLDAGRGETAPGNAGRRVWETTHLAGARC